MMVTLLLVEVTLCSSPPILSKWSRVQAAPTAPLRVLMAPAVAAMLPELLLSAILPV